VVSFQSNSGAEATILVSKNSGRYRVQGGSMEATWLLGSELAKRLTVHFQSSEGEPFELSCQDEMPLQEYFAVVDEHFAVRKALRATHDELAQQSSLYRHTQKRLLVRYKDRNPAPLDGEQTRAPYDH
jgi:Bardet-Biedl syndrome 9 protein